MALTPLAKQVKIRYAQLGFWEVHAIQQVHINDLARLKAEGTEQNAELIASVMRVINAFGEVLDERDGTTRVEAEATA